MSLLIALAAVPGMLGTQEAIRQGQQKERREEHRARRCNLIARCIKSSRRSGEIDGRPLVLRDGAIYVDTPTDGDSTNGHLYAGYYLPYPDSKYEGLVTTITDEAPIMNWVYIDACTCQLRYGIRKDAEPNLTGPFDCTRQSHRLTFQGWEGFCAVETEPNVWAVYFDVEDDGLRGRMKAGFVRQGSRVLEIELQRVEKRYKKDTVARNVDQTTNRKKELDDDNKEVLGEPLIPKGMKTANTTGGTFGSTPAAKDTDTSVPAGNTQAPLHASPPRSPLASRPPSVTEKIATLEPAHAGDTVGAEAVTESSKKFPKPAESGTEPGSQSTKLLEPEGHSPAVLQTDSRPSALGGDVAATPAGSGRAKGAENSAVRLADDRVTFLGDSLESEYRPGNESDMHGEPAGPSVSTLPVETASSIGKPTHPESSLLPKPKSVYPKEKHPILLDDPQEQEPSRGNNDAGEGKAQATIDSTTDSTASQAAFASETSSTQHAPSRTSMSSTLPSTEATSDTHSKHTPLRSTTVHVEPPIIISTHRLRHHRTIPTSDLQTSSESETRPDRAGAALTDIAEPPRFAMRKSSGSSSTTGPSKKKFTLKRLGSRFGSRGTDEVPPGKNDVDHDAEAQGKSAGSQEPQPESDSPTKSWFRRSKSTQSSTERGVAKKR